MRKEGMRISLVPIWNRSGHQLALVASMEKGHLMAISR